MQYQPSNPQLNEYYLQEAQLQYQQQAMGGMVFESLPRYTATFTMTESLRQMLGRTRPNSPGDYRLHAAYKGAAAQAFIERGTEITGALSKITAETALAAALWTPGVMMGGIVGGFALPMAAGYIMDRAGKYMGLDQAISQFSRINDLQIASQEFMGGIHSRDPFGKRMSRGGAKDVNDFLEDYARAIRTYSNVDITSDDLRKEVSQLSESKLLENVRSADDFARKFTSLKNAVSKITETLGKTFEEGVQVLGAMRQMNVNPFDGQAVVSSVRRMGTQAGLDFDTTFSSAMQGAIYGRQFRIAPEAGMMVGARAAADASILYQSGAISGSLLSRLGGEEGMRERIMQNMLTATQSPLVELGMLTAFSGGKMNFARLMEFGSSDNIMDSFRFDGGIGDLMDFKAQRGRILSEIMEDNPMFPQMMEFRQLLTMVNKTGEVFPNQDAKLQAMAELSGGRFDRDSLRLILEEIKSWRTGQERARMEDRMIGIGRAQDVGESGLFGMGRALRQSEIWVSTAEMGEDITRFSRNTVFEWTESIARDWRYATTGVYETGMSNIGDRVRDAEGNPVSVMRSYYFQDGLLNPSDGSDVLMDLERLGLERSLVRFSDSADPEGGLGAGYKERDGRFNAASQAWWRERLKEVNAGLPEEQRLAVNAFDRYAGREVTPQEIGQDLGLIFYTNKFDRGMFVSRRDRVDEIIDSANDRANFFREAADIDPEGVDMSYAVSTASTEIMRDFRDQVGTREAARIANSGFAAGGDLTRRIMPLIDQYTQNLSEKERLEVGAVVMNDIRTSMPKLATAVEGMDDAINLGLTKDLMEDADATLEGGAKAFKKSFMDHDDVLRITQGGRYAGLTAVVRGRVSLEENRIARAKLNALDEAITDKNFAGIVTAYNSIQSLRAKGMSNEEIWRTMQTDDDYKNSWDALQLLRPLGITMDNFESIYAGIEAEQAITLANRGTKQDKFIANYYTQLEGIARNWAEKRDTEGMSLMEYLESSDENTYVFQRAKELFDLSPQETINKFADFQGTVQSLSNQHQQHAAQVIQEGSTEKKGEIALEGTSGAGRSDTNAAQDKLFEAFLNSVMVDFNRTANAMIEAANTMKASRVS